jgi:hypothetical protein
MFIITEGFIKPKFAVLGVTKVFVLSASLIKVMRNTHIASASANFITTSERV